MAEKTKVYYEFRQINTDQVLILDRPAQVTFQLYGSTDSVIINNSLQISSRTDALTAPYKYTWELVLNNNENEIDVTNYQIRFTGAGVILLVIIKYYEKI